MFYVNSSLDPSDPRAAALGQPVKLVLPFAQETLNIYQVDPTYLYLLLNAIVGSDGTPLNKRAKRFCIRRLVEPNRL